MTPSAEIRIAAAVIVDADRRLLLVRKRGTDAFMQPGGKIETGEKPETCLGRELEEELGMHVDGTDMTFLGVYSAPAANEEGATVTADLFLVDNIGRPSPRAEIDELVWLDPPYASGIVLAPLTANSVVPLVAGLPGSGP